MRNLMLVTVAAASVFSGFAAPASAQQSTGSYQQTCRNVQVSGGTISAECADTSGRYRSTSMAYTPCRGDISNNNGALSCNGVNGSVGGYVGASPGGQQQNGYNGGQGGQQQQQNGYNGRQGGQQQQQGGYNGQQGGYNGRQGGQQQGYNGGDRRDNNDNTAAIVAGIAGLAAGLYTPGYAYPTYGDARYGDPRYDPRYAQGGYAYGQPRGTWVSIQNRADWLDQRIDRGVREGTVSRREAVSLRNALSALVVRERDYRRRGLQVWMRADLDKRFDQLAARIQYARADSYDRRDNGYGYGR